MSAMVDQPASTETQPGSVCPWCSARLTPDATTCPSCGANLTSEEGHELPGVTAVDHEAIRSLKKEAGRNRILSWISGEYQPEGTSPVEAGALQRPDPDVQREILRLELEAEVAKLQAEADARYADAVVEGRLSDLPEGLQAIATGSTLDQLMAALDASAGTSTAASTDTGAVIEPDAPAAIGAPVPDGEDTPAA
jgi:RNA polymerase subunit RPABC4/transcription elongation factor Spt4